MARPKTLGPVISMRLPLSLHTEIERRAASAGMSVGRYARRTLELELRPNGAKKAEKPTKQIKNQEPEPVLVPRCQHRHRALLAGGLAKCRSCGAMRRADGTWEA